jgi:polysaccharide biosynthesis protein PelA
MADEIPAARRCRTWIAKYQRGLLVSFLAFIALAFLDGGRDSQARDVRFLINYGSAVGERIAGYDVAVLDVDAAASTIAKRHPGATILGYLSLGEVHSGRDYFAEVKAAGYLLRPNPSWPDARFIDLRDRRWHKLVIERLVPAILAKGVNGLFFDTLDDAEFLEAQDPARFAGMVDAAAELLRGIRQRFPGIPLMVNRGYAVLPRAPGAFDMLLGESVFTTYDAKSGAYRLLPEADYRWQVERMRDAQRRDPKLRLFTLDYWNPEDPRGIARIYTQQRTNGFIPYVGTPDLTRIVSAP